MLFIWDSLDKTDRWEEKVTFFICNKFLMPDVFTVSVLGFKQRNSLSKEKKFCKVLSGHSNTVSC